MSSFFRYSPRGSLKEIKGKSGEATFPQFPWQILLLSWGTTYDHENVLALAEAKIITQRFPQDSTYRRGRGAVNRSIT